MQMEKWMLKQKEQVNKMKFEEKVKNLEEIINELENGEINLDESITKYTTAMKLIKECDTELKKVEEKVNKMVSENNEVSDFEISE